MKQLKNASKSVGRSTVKSWLAVFAFIFAGTSSADAYRCSNSNQLNRPSWMNDFGLNNDPEQVFGYSEARPKWRQSLGELNQILKAQAISNLAINIRADVKSSVSSEQNYVNDKGEERTVIRGSTQSQLSLGFLSGTQYFVDQANCVAYARVGIPKSQLPFVFAYSDFRSHQQKLENGTITLADISNFKFIETSLKSATENDATNNLSESIQLELIRVKAETSIVEISIRTQQLESGIDTARSRLMMANDTLNAIGNLQADGIEASELNSAKKALLRIRDEISATLGKNLTAIFWTADQIGSNAVKSLLERKEDRFYYADDISSLDALIDKAREFELKNALHAIIETENQRKLGFDEVDISIKLVYYEVQTGKELTSKIANTKAVGRPITNDEIKRKIGATLDGLL